MGIDRKYFFNIYWKLEKKIVPNLKYCQYFYEDVLFENVNKDTIWLDLGCGHQILPGWRSGEEKRLFAKAKSVVGIDYDFASLKKHENMSLKLRGDITSLPFRDNSFSLITSNMVIEHLKEPNVQFSEIFRILKPGGKFIFHTPNTLGYITVLARIIPNGVKDKLVYLLQGRKEEDVFPAYYRANSKKEITSLASQSGFIVESIRMLASSAQFVIIPPLVVLELCFIRLLMSNRFKMFRPYILTILRKE